MSDDLDIYQRNGVISVDFDDVERRPTTTTRQMSEVVADLPAQRLQFADGLHTDEQGHDGTLWSSGLVSRKDDNPKYRPVRARGTKYDHGLFYQFWLEDPQFRRSWNEKVEGLTTGHWSVRPPALPDDASDVELQKARRQTEWVESMLFDISGGWRQFLHDALFFLISGFSIFETVYYGPDAGDRAFGIKKLAFRYPKTVEAWILDDAERELLGVEFSNPATEDTYVLDANDVLLLRYNGFGLDFEGNSPLRPIAQWIKMKQLFQRLEAIAAEKYGVPILSIEKDLPDEAPAPSEDGQAQLVRVLSGMKAEDNPVLELPEGQKLVLHSPAGQVPDFSTQKRYCDEQISTILKAEGALVGTGDTGTYSLASEKADEAAQSFVYYADLVCEAINGTHGTPYNGIIPKMVELRDGGPVRPGMYPRLEYQLAEDQQGPDRLDDVVKAQKAGLLTWRAEDEKTLREQLGLEPINEDEFDPEPAEDAGGDGGGDGMPPMGLSDGGGGPNFTEAEAGEYLDWLRLNDRFDPDEVNAWLDQHNERLARRLEDVATEHKQAFKDAVDDADGLKDVREIKRRFESEWPKKYRSAIRREIYKLTVDGARAVQIELGILDDVDPAPVTGEAGEAAKTYLLNAPSKEFEDHVDLIADDMAQHAYNLNQHELVQVAEQRVEGATASYETPSRSSFAGVANTYSAASFGQGRHEYIRQLKAEAEDAGIDDPRIVAERSSVLDDNTCSQCEDLDGERALVGSASYADKSPPHYCDGRKRCRCIWFYITPDEQNFEQFLDELR